MLAAGAVLHVGLHFCQGVGERAAREVGFSELGEVVETAAAIQFVGSRFRDELHQDADLFLGE